MESWTLKAEIEKKQRENEDLRNQLQQSHYEFQDFKKRMGKVVDLTLGSSGDLSEDLMNPCRESKLKNMYKILSQNTWANLVPQLNKGGAGMSAKYLRKQAEQRIKDVLQQSQNDIQDIINTMKRFTPSSQGDSNNPKTTQYFDSTIHNLQMAIYYEKTGLYNTDKLQGVPEVLRPMAEECYKIGSLMALHNPPLLLDFDNCDKGPFPPIKTNCSCAAAEMSDSIVFIAVDFGMEFSGYCFKFAVSEQIWQPKWGKEFGFDTPKTPTSILFDENEKFLKFGYDAVMTYTRQTKKDEAMKLYFFDNFKRELHGKELHRDIMLKAKNGKQMRAMKVFTESLRFMKDHALEMIKQHTSGVKQSASDAMWILTVPAIWSAAAKQFMREAATEAGLVTEAEPDRLIIALEPEVASMWCRQLQREGFMEGNLRESEKIEDFPGTQYMVVDCGGGSVDITVHEIVTGGHLRELYWISGKNMDIQTVDQNFKTFLKELVCEVFDEIDKKHSSDLQRLVYACNGNLQCSFNTWLGHLQELFRKVNDTGAYSKENPDWEQKLRAKVASFYDDSLNSIESLIKEALRNHKLNISYIFLVGGFALSPYVNRFIREKFGWRYKVLCPVDAQMAVLRGAVGFGMIPNVVESRISRYTYGVAILVRFDPIKHKGKSKCIARDGVECCNVCFHSLVQKNESVHFDEDREFDFTTTSEREPKTVQLDFYCTERETAEFVDEPGMMKIGSIIVPVPKTKSASSRTLKLKLKVKFGVSEMQATVTDVNSGVTSSVRMEIMSK